MRRLNHPHRVTNSERSPPTRRLHAPPARPYVDPRDRAHLHHPRPDGRPRRLRSGSGGGTGGTGGGNTANTDASYADGTYTADGSYNAPSGTESITVEVTLADDKITEITVTPHATDPTAKGHQAEFVGGIADRRSAKTSTHWM